MKFHLAFSDNQMFSPSFNFTLHKKFQHAINTSKTSTERNGKEI